MKRSLVLALAASVGLVVLSGCGSSPIIYDFETFRVDASSATLNGSDLAVSMTHQGPLKEGMDGWTFQVYLDADHDPATGVEGAEYLVNGFEGRDNQGYVVRHAETGGKWGDVVGRVGSDDGATLTLSVPLAMVPPTAAEASVRLVVYARHKLVHDKTFVLD